MLVNVTMSAKDPSITAWLTLHSSLQVTMAVVHSALLYLLLLSQSPCFGSAIRISSRISDYEASAKVQGEKDSTQT